MNRLTCEMCNSIDLVKQDGYFVCQSCGTKYTLEEAKKMMIEGTVDVQGTVKVDNTSFVEKYLQNARRALMKEDWSEVEKYYNLVEQNDPENIEAIFYSAYAKLREIILEPYSAKWDGAFSVMKKSISILDDYYNVNDSEKEDDLIEKAVRHILVLADPKANNIIHGMADTQFGDVSNAGIKNRTKSMLLPELKITLDNIIGKKESAGKDSSKIKCLKELLPAEAGCYVATAVYGSYDCPQVWTLRRFRDYTLAETWHGRAFIKMYYSISPTLVKWFGHTKWFKKMWKGKLDRMVASLNSEGVEDTPYEDRKWN